MDIQVKVIRSRRKSISLQIDSSLVLTVRAPYRMRDREIQAFIQEKSDWIEKTMEKVKKQTLVAPEDKLTSDEIRTLADRALKYIPDRVAYFSTMVGVTYGRITIRNQRSRWGSCSSKGNLNFNCLLMLMPQEIIDYVVVHELCHRREMNHSQAFWKEVEKVLPDYKARRKWLKDNGGAIMAHMER